MQDPIYAKIESTPRPSLFAASGLIWLAAVGLWLSELALRLLPAGLSADSTFVNILYYLPFVVLPVALYTRRRPGLGEAMRLNPLPLLPVLAVGLLAVLSVFIASLLTAAWGQGLNALGLTPLDSYAPPGDERSMLLAIVALAAMPAVCEELLFRGFVLAAWESRGTWFAVAVSAGLFALLHGNLYGIPSYLLVGAIAGFATFALDSVYAGMIYHTVYNAACLVIPWLLEGQAAEEAAQAAGAVPILSMVLETMTLLAMTAMLLATLRVWAHARGAAPIPRIRRPLEGREKWMLAIAVGTMAISTLVIVALSARAGGAT